MIRYANKNKKYFASFFFYLSSLPIFFDFSVFDSVMMKHFYFVSNL